MKIALKLLLVVALVGPHGPAQVAEARSPAVTGLNRAWQGTKLVLGQAVRQAKMIKGNPRLGRWTKARKSLRAVARSLCTRRPPAVLLYQGAFDPVHTGHLTNLEAALVGVKNVKQVYLVPTSEHPGKTPVDHRHRVAMLRGALSGCEQKLPSDVRAKIEVVDNPHLARLSMAGFDDLTAMIHTKHPGARVYIVTGSDAFVRAEDRDLVSQARRWGYRYAVTPRSGHPVPAKLPVGVEVMPLSGGGESSTWIRQQLKAQRVPDKPLPDTAASYIREHQLYGYRGPR